MNKFTIKSNNYLRNAAYGYYYQYYTGYRQPDNPDFLNILKNTFNNISKEELLNAQKKVVKIITDDLPLVINDSGMANCMFVCVPRAKSLSSFSNKQLMLKEAVKIAGQKINGVTDGTDCIIRVVNTRTTHLAKAEISNDGELPYPGITRDTCKIDRNRVAGRNIILFDDIYTRNVNIDEDCIQVLRDNGANSVIFYSIAYTR